MALQADLEHAIHAVAPRATMQPKRVNGRLSGLVIAEEFDPMTHLERQRAVWAKIREELGARATKVGVLLQYSPEEADAVADTE